MEALFTLVFSSDISPVAVGAIVALSQLIDRFYDQPGANRIVGSESRLLTLNNLVRTGNEPILVPLIAGTGLPLLTTDIAELGTATTSRGVSKELKTTSRDIVRTLCGCSRFRVPPVSYKSNNADSC